ncbi:hypothetical protein JCM10908_005106 [Rhodotorula pacifica]|uniref:rRNA-processing protein RRP17 n=1 Tax=Rhodotorula pacifica TaxID=1495444 RepID=UPI003176B561
MAPSRSSGSSNRKGKGKASTGPELDANGRPPKIKRVKEVVFDADARKEYLTGFSKRKKAKQTLRRNKAIEREKTALNQMRKQIRDERKQRAAQNVKIAKEMYGDAGSGDDEDEDEDEDMSGSGSDSDAEEEDEAEAAYEGPDSTLTTVTVEPLSLSRSPTPDPHAFDASTLPPPPTTAKPTQQGSVHKKRVKNAPQARPKLTRQEKKDRATGAKKVKKKLANKMKGTKGRANK